jgi:hypothetical protein
MERIFYLHAGPPKTGTTAIQRFFRDNAAVFAKQDFFRPLTGAEDGSHYHAPLVEAFRPGQDRLLRTQLAAEITGRGRPGRVFVTAEHFAVRLVQPDFVDRLAAFCQSLGYRLHVIFYVRPPAPLLNSLYTQYVKNWRPVLDMDGFLSRELGRGAHDYMRLLAALHDRPDISLTLRPFNAGVLKRGLTQDLCETMGLSTEGETLAAREEQVNVSPGARTVAAFLRLRTIITRDYPDLPREALAPLTYPLVAAAGPLGWNDEAYGGITPDQERRIADSLASGCEALARRHWNRSWNEVFSERECQPPPYRVFVPKDAPPQQRRKFREVIEQSLELVATIAALDHRPPPRE